MQNDRPLTKDELRALDEFADKLFGQIGIDIEFTRHFLDRVNDPRNRKQITLGELAKLFKEIYHKWGKPIKQMGPDAEAVMKDLQTKINLPFVLVWDRRAQELDLIAKSVMRKDKFGTSNRVFAVEDSPESVTDPEDMEVYVPGLGTYTVKTLRMSIKSALEDLAARMEKAGGSDIRTVNFAMESNVIAEKIKALNAAYEELSKNPEYGHVYENSRNNVVTVEDVRKTYEDYVSMHGTSQEEFNDAEYYNKTRGREASRKRFFSGEAGRVMKQIHRMEKVVSDLKSLPSTHNINQTMIDTLLSLLHAASNELKSKTVNEGVEAGRDVVNLVESYLIELGIIKPKPSETAGIDRDEMPQIHSGAHQDFFKFIKDTTGVTTSKVTVKADTLSATQGEFKDEKIKKAIDTMTSDQKSEKEIPPIIISSDNFVIDGHHRWLAALNLDTTLDAYRVNTDWKSVIELAKKFPQTTFKDIDNKVVTAESVMAMYRQYTSEEAGGVGKIVKGVNTTKDVGVDAIKKQAAKFGNKVDSGGNPPLLSTSKKKTSPNTLFNLGMVESTNEEVIDQEDSELPMDKASRLSRAKQMGFDTTRVWYHGTTQDFDQFSDNELSKNTNAFSAGFGHFLTSDPKVASNFAGAYGSVIPVFVRGDYLDAGGLAIMNDKPQMSSRGQIVTRRDGKPLLRWKIDPHDAIFDMFKQNPNVDISTWKKERLASGKSGMLIPGTEYDANISNWNGYPEPHDVLVVFDPSNIRSIHAKFDPKDSRSSMLMASASDNQKLNVQSFANIIKEKYNLKHLWLGSLDSRNAIELSSIIVGKDSQKQGTGTKAMEEIVAFADAHGRILVLDPGSIDKKHGTTSQARLRKFYKRFGFIENKGRNKNYEFRHLMIRYPESGVTEEVEQVSEIKLGGSGIEKNWRDSTEITDMAKHAKLSHIGDIEGYKVYIEKVSHIEVFLKEPKKNIFVGHLLLEVYDRDSRSYIATVAFDPSIQGKGLAAKLYAYVINKLDVTIISDISQTKGSKSLWEKLSRLPGINVYGWNGKHDFFIWDPDEDPDEEIYNSRQARLDIRADVEQRSNDLVALAKAGEIDMDTASEKIKQINDRASEQISQLVKKPESSMRLIATKDTKATEKSEITKESVTTRYQEFIAESNNVINEIVADTSIGKKYGDVGVLNPMPDLTPTGDKISGLDVYVKSPSNSNDIDTVAVKDGDQVIGALWLQDHGFGKETNVVLKSKYHGKGIAHKMYMYAIEQLGMTLVSDLSQTKGSEAIWRKLAKTPGVFVYAWAKKRDKFFQWDPDVDPREEVYFDDATDQYYAEIERLKKEVFHDVQKGEVSYDDGREKVAAIDAKYKKKIADLQSVMRDDVVLVATTKKGLEEGTLQESELLEIRDATVTKRWANEEDLEHGAKDAKKTGDTVDGYDIYIHRMSRGVEIFLRDPETDEYIGALWLLKRGHNSGDALYSEVAFKEEYQGKGLALKVYTYAVTNLGITITSDQEQSKGSKLLWKNLAAMPGVFVYAWDPDEDEYFQWNPDEDDDTYIYASSSAKEREELESDLAMFIYNMKNDFSSGKLSKEKAIAAIEDKKKKIQSMIQDLAWSNPSNIRLVATPKEGLAENTITEIRDTNVMKAWANVLDLEFEASSAQRTKGKIDGYSVYIDKSEPGSAALYLRNDKEKEFIGVLWLLKNKHDIGDALYSTVAFKEEYQGKGLALKLYTHAIVDLGYTIVSDKEQSKGSQIIWKNLASQPNVFVYAWNPATDDYFQWDPEEDDMSYVYAAASSQDFQDLKYHLEMYKNNLQKDANAGKISAEEAMKVFAKKKKEVLAKLDDIIENSPDDIRLVATANNIDAKKIDENMSITGTETARDAKRKGIEPGTEAWFKHWFSLPYMIPKSRSESHAKKTTRRRTGRGNGSDE